MDESTARDILTGYGFRETESEGYIEYISAENADNASVQIYVTDGKIQKISVSCAPIIAG